MTRLAPSIRSVLRWALVTAGAILVMLALAVGLLQIDAITTWAVRVVAGIVAPPGTRITLARASGSVLGSLRVDSLTILRSDTDTAVAIERVSIRYDLAPLLRRRLAISDVAIASPDARLYRQGDSTWTFLSKTAPEPEPASPWSVTVGRITLDDGTILLLRRPDSIDQVRHLVIRGRDVSFGDTTAFTVDSLSATILKAGMEETPGKLLAALSFGPRGVEVDTLSLVTTESRVVASGSIAIGEAGVGAVGSRFSAVAEPLALDEITPFVPAVGGPPIGARIEARTEAPGRLRWTLALEGAERAVVDLAGTLAWRGDTLRGITVDGRWSRVDPAKLATAVRTPGLLGGQITADLHGPTPTTWTGTARLDLEPSTFGATEIRRGTLRVAADSGQLALRLDAGVADFRIGADGEIGLPTRRYSLKGEVRSQARMTRALVSASGEGFPPSGTGHFEVRADSIRAGKTTIPMARLTGVLIRDSLAARLDADLPEGRLSVRLAGHPFGEAPRARLLDGRLEAIDLRSLSGGGAPGSSINGTFTGAIAGVEPATADARLDVTLDASVVGRQAIAGGRVALRLTDGRAGLTGRVMLPAGSLEVTGSARPFAEPIRYAVDSARFRRIDLAAWLGQAAWRTDLSGTMSLEGSGVDPARLVADGRVDLEPSAINRGPVSGSLVWRASGGRITGASRLGLGDGATVLSGVITVTEPMTYEVRARVDAPVLGPLLGRPDSVSLAADVELAGRGTERSTIDGRLTVDLRGAGYSGIRADSGRMVLQARGGVVRADTIWVRSNAGTIAGSGVVPLVNGAPPADFSLEARVESLAPFESLRPGTALSLGSSLATVTVTGPADRLVVAGDGRIDALAVGAIRLVGLTGTGQASFSWEEGVASSQARVQLDDLRLPTASVRRITVEQRYRRGDGLTLATTAQVDGERTIEAAVRLDPGQPDPWWTIDQARLQSGSVEWTLARPARVRYRPTLAIDSLVLRAPGRLIAADGGFDPDGATDLHVSIDSFPVATIADLAGFPRLEGSLSSRIDLTGSGSALRGGATLDFAMVESGEGLGVVHLEAAVEGDSIAVSGAVDQRKARVARLTGSVVRPAGTRAAAIDLRLRADSFAIAGIQPFVDPELAQIEDGRISGDFRVAGSIESPRLGGALRLLDGRVRLPRYGVTYSRAELVLALEQDEVRITRGTLYSGGGTLEATGVARVREVGLADLDLALTADAFQAVRSDQIRAVVSGDVAIRGTTRNPAVTGKVTVLRGDLDLGGYAGGQVEDVELTESDYRMLESYLGFPVQREGRTMIPTLEETTVDLTVTIGRDSWLRQRASPEMALQFSGRIRVRKELGPELQLVGQLDPIAGRSYVEQFGRRFELRRGALVFAGGPLDTRIDIEAQYTVPSRDHNQPEVVIVLGVQGKVEDLAITLASEPTMENADIVSYIATGRPASSALDVGGGGEGGGLASAGTAIALDRATGLVESAAKQEIGLDVIEIRREGLGGATLVAGRYVSPTLYLGFKQPITVRNDEATRLGQEGRTEVEIELQAYRWLLLNFQGGGGALQFFLRARHGY